MAHLVGLGTMTVALLLAPAAGAQTSHADHDTQKAYPVAAGLLQEVRNATQRFWDPKLAELAEYHPFLGCVSGTQEGAMGVHYVNSSLVFDEGQLDPQKPEALLYETRNGKQYLLGAEFIVIAADWDKNNAAPPALLGQVFTYNTSPNRFGLDPFYALHVWAWRDNPHGTFVDWNPKVSCDGFTPIR